MNFKSDISHFINFVFESSSISSISLCGGMLGYVLALYQLGQKSKCQFITHYADTQLESCLYEIPSDMSCGFSDGISGIGWAIEFLINKGFIQGNPDDVLYELDRKIESIHLLRMYDQSWENGLPGIAFYLALRISSCGSRGKIHNFSESFISELNHLIRGDKLIEELFRLTFNDLIDKGYEMFNNILAIHNSKLYNFIKWVNAFQKNDVPANPGKASVYLITEHCKGQRYGVGTYLDQIASIKELRATFDIIFIHLRSTNDSFQIQSDDNITHLWFPDLSNLYMPYSSISQQKYIDVVTLAIKTYHDSLHPGQPVICHTNFFGWSNLILNLKKILPAKIIHTMHYSSWSFDTLGNIEELQTALNSQVKNKLQRMFLEEKEYLIGVCDCVIAISKHSRDSLLSLYGLDSENVVHIANPIKFPQLNQRDISELRKKLGIPEGAKVLFFAGRLDPVKGVKHLIEATKSIIEEDSTTILAIAGDGNFQGCLEAIRPYYQNIILLGFLNKEELYEWYTVSDLGIVPSLYEEFGYVAIEMLLYGLPIIVNNTSGLREIVMSTGTGTLVDITDYRQTINAISLALNNRKRVPASIRRTMESLYGEKAFSSTIIHLYQCLIG